MRLKLHIALAGALAVTSAVEAYATLGGSAGTVQADRVQLRAHIEVAQRHAQGVSSYEVQSLTDANGTVILEYFTPQGAVFAVKWQGPWHPNLKQLLGSYFSTYQSAAAARRGQWQHRLPLEIRRDDLHLSVGGRGSAKWGAACVPALLPAGVSCEGLQ